MGASLCENSRSQVCLEQLLIAVKGAQCGGTRNKSVPPIFSESRITQISLSISGWYTLTGSTEQLQPTRQHRDSPQGYFWRLRKFAGICTKYQWVQLAGKVSATHLRCFYFSKPSLLVFCAAKSCLYVKYLERILVSFSCCQLCW